MPCANQFDTAQSCAADRVLDEGAQPLLLAARAAGLKGDAELSLRTLLRNASTGKLEAIKIAGRWLTSAAAIRRWVASQQRQGGLASGEVPQ